MEKNEKILEDKIKDLETRISKLEEVLTNRDLINKPPIMPLKRYDANGKKQSMPQVFTKKGEVNVTVTNDLKVKDDKGRIFEVGEELIVKNGLVLGDKLLVVVKNESVESIKVSQRAKRIKEEALVTIKDSMFYAVSKFNTHRLINYDVLSRGVLKGFEIKIILPKDFEKNADVVIIDSVESSGGFSAEKENNNEIPLKIKNSDIRVVENDDLV